MAVKKSAGKIEKVQVKSPTDNPINKLLSFSDKIVSFKSDKRFYLILIVLGILVLAVVKKSWFIAAIVNGTPVTNLELQMKLNQQFKEQTLNQLINEKIILSEAAKNNAVPTSAEVTSKIAELEASVGGAEALNTLLTQQGQTRDTIRDQVMLQLAVTKLYEKEATVSAEEVAKFVEDNQQLLKASDSASQQKEAAEAIKNQKLSQIISEKFQALRQAASIKIF